MSRRQKFIDLTEARVNKAAKMIQLIGNLSNRSAYEYTEEDVRAIFKALQLEIDSAKARFVSKRGGASDAFSLNR